MRRIVVGGLIIALLLLPSWLQAMTWTPINFWVALTSILISLLLVYRSRRWRWPSALVTGVLIAVAPYPNWLWASNDRGWHFQLGYKLKHWPEYATEFVIYYLVVVALLFVLFRVMEKRALPQVQ
ncbi:hypothetical protein MNR01_16375 [Lysobacter sp. S4-A87]|uniref:hypothetical protein n=1 Tax=Lysobacter sp. S4-A87 TaxID=2925843 RepID=UPI001F52E83D|nr:hypothetical protein [Lysobacter sp. S4-A87]UNK49280.1 hypothetical protein MNR01_16375 [Lysobacter sp. S4-A87]